jgi:hypothetical protein
MPLSAQIRASEIGTVSQTVDGTTIMIEYSRPRARGRDPIFGGVVHWGEHWTPGANWATTLEVDHDIHLDGHPVAAGKYSLWMVVQPDEWVVYLDPEPRIFHTDIPDSTDAQIRFTVVPEERPFIESMTIWFPEMTSTGATIATQWGTTYVSMDISVEPSRSMTLADDKAVRYVGSYAFTWAPEPGEEDGDPSEAQFTVTYEDGFLMARLEPGPPWFSEMVLIEIADDWFQPGVFEDGELYDVMTGLTFEFDPESDSASRFDLRWITDDVIATAEREED